jgi:hypothetical protein
MVRRLALLGALFPFPFVGPGPSPEPKALVLVVADGPRRETDEVLRQRLAAHGYGVTLAPAESLREGRLRGAHVVVLSPGVSLPAMGRAGTLSTPMVVLSALAFPRLGMSVDRPGEDFGLFSQAEAVSLLIEGDHPLSAGLSGERAITSASGALGWATPAAEAVVVARSAEHSERAVLFAYEAGAYLVSGPAPARRVGFGLSEQAIVRLRRY